LVQTAAPLLHVGQDSYGRFQRGAGVGRDDGVDGGFFCGQPAA